MHMLSYLHHIRIHRLLHYHYQYKRRNRLRLHCIFHKLCQMKVSLIFFAIVFQTCVQHIPKWSKILFFWSASSLLSHYHTINPINVIVAFLIVFCVFLLCSSCCPWMHCSLRIAVPVPDNDNWSEPFIIVWHNLCLYVHDWDANYFLIKQRHILVEKKSILSIFVCKD